MHTKVIKSIDVESVRKQFPILSVTVHKKPLVYLDNAATTQKPLSVIDSMDKFYREYNSNIHRGVHKLSQLSTSKYEKSRQTIQGFIKAAEPEEIIFTKGTTESINLVAYSYGLINLTKDDEILISHMEHHANIVPWQILCQKTGAVLKVIPINDNGELIMEEFYKLLSHKTKIVSIVHISNSLGTINPIKEIIDAAHAVDAVVLIDAAQSVHHASINVQELNPDFLVFSGHKVYGPTGIGVLYGKRAIFDTMPPYQTGGDMIKSVSFEKTIFNDLPQKFEAGTTNIAGAIGLAKSLEFIDSLGIENIAAYEANLLNYATEKLSQIEQLKIIGTAAHKSAVLSFVLDCAHPHDIGTLLDMEGVAVRTGQHCTEPLMKRFGVPATTRASFAVYNTYEEIDVLYNSVLKVIKLFS
ncbi:MAG: cysteine desulfurase [Candidatus Kapabacteria bacterium]|nr:cysteine desulfurase [Candidatus Kapabacteria bacterium]